MWDYLRAHRREVLLLLLVGVVFAVALVLFVVQARHLREGGKLRWPRHPFSEGYRAASGTPVNVGYEKAGIRP